MWFFCKDHKDDREGCKKLAQRAAAIGHRGFGERS
jgi:hypothetical protein